MKKSHKVAMICVAMTIFAATPATFAVGEPGTRTQVMLPDGVSIEMVQSQEQADAALDRVWEAVPGDGGSAAGFAGSVVDAKMHTVSLYWKGEVPAEVQAGLKGEGVTTKMHDVPYSQADVDGYAKLIYSLAKAGVIPQPTNVGLTSDSFDQIKVGFTAAELSRAGAAESLRRDIRTATGVDVLIVDGPRFVGASRQNDSDPWYGGAAPSSRMGWIL